MGGDRGGALAVVRRLLFRPEAETDVREAREWYEGQRRGLGRAFREELAATLSTIRARPQLYAEVYAPVRRAPLRRFPYSVFYFEQGEVIEVLAVLSQSRDPRSWPREAP